VREALDAIKKDGIVSSAKPQVIRIERELS
jgi:hypothetical protein